MVVVFGYLTDFGVWVLQGVKLQNYVQQWIFCIIEILLVGVGVNFEVTAGVVTLAGEGLLLAICQVAPIKFGNMKVLFDVFLVVIACILSLVFVRGLHGVRERTLAATVCVGQVAKFLNMRRKRLISSPV